MQTNLTKTKLCIRQFPGFFCIYLFQFFETGFPCVLELTLQTRLALNSQRSICLCLLSARIKGVHHCAQIFSSFLSNSEKLLGGYITIVGKKAKLFFEKNLILVAIRKVGGKGNRFSEVRERFQSTSIILNDGLVVQDYVTGCRTCEKSDLSKEF